MSTPTYLFSSQFSKRDGEMKRDLLSIYVVDDWFKCAFFFLVQALGKREPEQEREAQQWIENITQERFPAGKYNILVYI